ncbi:MAG: DUF1902 domain-containing protein [Gammaproteobacteria bacterium]|nr:DUF1902 domain-containing protein [Gammaproteobacteria bacterium]
MSIEQVIRVNALWDDEAGVWSASSEDIAGLAIEAKTKEGLVERLKVVIPELLELNHAEAPAVARAERPEIAPIELLIAGSQRLQLAW